MKFGNKFDKARQNNWHFECRQNFLFPYCVVIVTKGACKIQACRDNGKCPKYWFRIYLSKSKLNQNYEKYLFSWIDLDASVRQFVHCLSVCQVNISSTAKHKIFNKSFENFCRENCIENGWNQPKDTPTMQRKLRTPMLPKAKHFGYFCPLLLYNAYQAKQ